MSDQFSATVNVEIPSSHDMIEGVLAPCVNPYLAGHEEVSAFLAQAYRLSNMHHALLFEGEQGTGKATLAFHLAGHMLRFPDGTKAPDRIATPDITMPLYRQIAGGMNPAVLHISRPLDPKSGKFRTVITVEEIRKITHFLTRTAHDGGWRIVIVDPADDLNRNAANALLKMLEEPPEKVLFVLISHSSGRLLPTIRSRCQGVAFKPLDDNAMIAAIHHCTQISTGLEAGDEKTATLLTMARGSVRRAVLLLLNGGLEIAAATDELIASPLLDLPKLQALGQVLSAREAEVQYELFVEHLMERIAQQAELCAQAGELRAASAWAEFWARMNHEINESETFNLDRKQTVMTAIEKLRRFAADTMQAKR